MKTELTIYLSVNEVKQILSDHVLSQIDLNCPFTKENIEVSLYSYGTTEVTVTIPADELPSPSTTPPMAEEVDPL